MFFFNTELESCLESLYLELEYYLEKKEFLKRDGRDLIIYNFDLFRQTFS